MLSSFGSRRWKRCLPWIVILACCLFFICWIYTLQQPQTVQLPKKFMYPSEIASPLFQKVESVMKKHLDKDTRCKWHARYTNQSLPTCSFSVIRNYMEECGYFPHGLTLTPDDKPILKFCHLPAVSKDAILKYLHEHVDNIVSMGDSQGARYSGWMIGRLKQFGVSCEMVKGEPVGFRGRKEYFFNDTEINNALIDPERKCQTCTSFKRKCQIPATSEYESKTIYIEYISMIMHNINTTMVNSEYCKERPDIPVCQYRTLADIIFKYYLKDAYPDMLILFPTFAHDIGVSLSETIPNIEYINKLVVEYFPARTQVLWLPAASANYKRFPVGTVEHGEGINARIDMLNHWLFESIITSPHNAPTLHGYFDIGEIGRIREMEWADDFIHFLPPYYQVVADTMLALIPSLEL